MISLLLLHWVFLLYTLCGLGVDTRFCTELTGLELSVCNVSYPNLGNKMSKNRQLCSVINLCAQKVLGTLKYLPHNDYPITIIFSILTDFLYEKLEN